MFHKKRKSSVPDSPEESISPTPQSVNEDKGRRSGKKSRKPRRKTVFLIIITAVIAVSGIAVFLSVTGNQGIRKSQKLAKKIGEPLEKAAASAGVELMDSSDFELINELCTFNSLYESERSTSVYDVKMPEWTIYCSENSFGKLESVTYCDFRVLSSSINGIKKSSEIDVSRISTGSTASEVDDVLKMDPYQVVYSENSTARKYRYYYKNKQSGVVKAYCVTVIFGEEGKVNSPVIVENNDFIFDVLKVESD